MLGNGGSAERPSDRVSLVRRPQAGRRPGEALTDGQAPAPRRPQGQRSRLFDSGILLAAVVLLVAVTYFVRVSGSGQPSAGPTAAFFSPPGLALPNSGFVKSAADTFRRAGYSVVYYPPDGVTVEAYRDLMAANLEYVI